MYTPPLFSWLSQQYGHTIFQKEGRGNYKGAPWHYAQGNGDGIPVHTNTESRHTVVCHAAQLAAMPHHEYNLLTGKKT